MQLAAGRSQWQRNRIARQCRCEAPHGGDAHRHPGHATGLDRQEEEKLRRGVASNRARCRNKGRQRVDRDDLAVGQGVSLGRQFGWVSVCGERNPIKRSRRLWIPAPRAWAPEERPPTVRGSTMNRVRWIQVVGFAFAIALVGGAARAQAVDKSAAIATVQQKNPNLRFTINPRTGMPSGVTGLTRTLNPAALTSSVAEPNDDQVRQAVDQWFLAGEAAEAYAPRNRRAKYETQNVRKDPDLPGQWVAHVEQRLNGVPVFGSSAKVTVDRTLGLTAAPVTDSVSAVNIDNTQAQVSEADAIAAARSYLAGVVKNKPSFGTGMPIPDVTTAAATSELVIFDPALISAKVEGPTRLAFLVTVGGFRVFVDAKTKEVFYFYRNQQSGLLRRIFDLAQSTTFPGTEVIDDQAQLKADPLNTDVQLAYTNTGLVRDFYFQVFGRDSYNDNGRGTPTPAGAPIESYVRVGSIRNAFWCPQAGDPCPKADVMLFGPDYAGAIDVVGHEITHGVI